MKHLRQFEQWKSSFAVAMNEQETNTGKGFIVVFGSTDNDNLKAGAAEPLGFKENEIITGTINGVQSMLKIGASKSFQNADHPGKSVKPGVDYLNVTANGQKYSVKEKGVIEIPFTKDTVLEIEGAGNGLLALMRALYYLNVSVTKNKFDINAPFDGTIFLKLGDTARKGLALSVNGKYDQQNSVRITGGYADIHKKFEAAVDLGEAPQQESAVEQIVVSADTIADAIKAGHFYMKKEQYRSKFSAFQGFRDMFDSTRGDDWPKGMPQKGSNFLAVSFQYAIAQLSQYYPMDLSKVYKIDLEPYAVKILQAQPDDLRKFDATSIRTNLTEMLNQFAPKELKDYPEFNSQLPKYWAVITNAIVNRVMKMMPMTFNYAMANNSAGAPVQVGGSVGTGKTDFGSGKIN